MEEQEWISSTLDEVDCLCKEQKKSLDLTKQLIPALFSEMFENSKANFKKWTVKNLEDVVDLLNGYAFKTSEWTDSGLPIIRIQNLNNSSKPYNFFSGTLPDKFLVHPDDILLSWSGTPGTSFGCFRWNGPQAWLNQHIFKVVFKEKINKDYFVQFVNYNLDVLIKNAVGGVGLRHVTKSTLNSMLITLPPLTLQMEFSEKIQEIQSLYVQQQKSLKVFDSLFESLMHQVFAKR